MLTPLDIENKRFSKKINGYNADDVDDFANKLKTLMLDKELRIKMGKNAREDMKNYSPKIIIDKWEKLFNYLLSK